MIIIKFVIFKFRGSGKLHSGSIIHLRFQGILTDMIKFNFAKTMRNHRLVKRSCPVQARNISELIGTRSLEYDSAFRMENSHF